MPLKPKERKKKLNQSQIEAKNPSGQTVVFDTVYHRFTLKSTGRIIPGTTGFIKQFFQEFDADRIAAECAGKGKYAGMDAEQIKHEWKKESLRGQTEGTNVHNYAEYKYNPTIPKPKPISKRCKGLFAAVDHAFERFSKWFDFVASEKIIFSPELNIAGIVDLVLQDKENQDFVILDWKQNKQISMSNQWQRAFPPISHLDDCDLVKYNLQLSIYKKILAHENYFGPSARYRMGLVHLLPNGTIINIKLEDMDSDVDKMLASVSEKQITLFT